MKALWRILVVASAALLGAGTAALAQETAAPPQTSPPQTDVVGPPQLQNFSLDGTVTREAEDPVQVQSRTQQPETTAATRPQQPARESTPDPARIEPASRNESAMSATRSAAVDLPPPTAARRVATTPVGAIQERASLTPQPGFAPAAADADVGTAPGDVPLLPWLIAALAVAGAAAWYFLRQRPRESYAGAGAINAFQAPSPAPATQPPVRTPPPAAAPKPSSSGIVSTRLRPWLEIEFTPQRAMVDDAKAAIAFELTVFNSGSAPARDVLLEASLFNAGPMQDEQIRLFFENPVAKGDRIPVIPPMKKVSVNTAVFLPRDQVRPIEVEGRQLLVPMIAFNALYGWGSGKGQTSASYLVGKATQGEKLAPFRLDLGPRVFRKLEAREHELRLRN